MKDKSNKKESDFPKYITNYVFLFVIIFSLNLVAQTSYYISNSGNDTNNGTSENTAWRTIEKLNKYIKNTGLNPGDKVFFRRGDVFDDTELKVLNSGSANKPILFSSYGNGNKPIIGSNALKAFSFGLFINNKDYITIDGLEIHAPKNKDKSSGIVLKGNYLTVKNCTVKGSDDSQNYKRSGIAVVKNGSSNIKILNNDVMHFGVGIIAYGTQHVLIEGNKVHDIHRPDGKGWGIRLISNDFPHWYDYNYTGIVRGNEIYDFSRYGIDCATASRVIIENNYIHSNTSNPNKSQEYGSGIKAGEKNATTMEGSIGNIIRYNVIYNLYNGGSGAGPNDGIVTVNSEDGEIYGNLIYDIAGKGITRTGLDNTSFNKNLSWKIYHNTIISNKNCIYIEVRTTSPTYIMNNIFSVNDNSYSAIYAKRDIYEGNNIFTNRIGVSSSSKDHGLLAVFQKYGTYNSKGEKSFFNTKPNFKNASNKDYKLSKDSPSIDKGVPVGSSGDGQVIVPFGYISGIPDIGAFEYIEGSGGNSSPSFTPTITQQPSNQSVNIGETVTFSITATSADPIGYQWWRSPFISESESKITNNSKYSGATTNQLTINNVQTEDGSVNYVCEVYNTTDRTNLWVNSEPAKLTITSTNSSGFVSGNGLKVFLEGAYKQGKMNTIISSLGILPLKQPYNILPWKLEENSSISSRKNNYVDWILVELRDNTTRAKYRKAGILTENGKVINTDGSDFSFSNIIPGNYYVVIKHRNHLSVMSSKTVTIENNVRIDYDFTISQNLVYGNNSLVNFNDGNLGMISGDGDANNIINNLDFGAVANKIPFIGYDLGDLDMNGDINVLDYIYINKNILKKTNVP